MGPEPLLFAEAYLFQSHLSQGGVIYERLARYPLAVKTNLPL
jgi:2'-5' RNA ligase